MVAVASQTVEGHVSRGFEAVREVFAELHPQARARWCLLCLRSRREGRRPLGRDSQQRNWRAVGRDTMVLVPAAKGLSAMTLAIAHSRGWLVAKSGSPRT